MIAGYRIPGHSDGQAFTLPNFCFGWVFEVDADRIAATLRQETGKEPHWQTVRGKLITLARHRARKESETVAGKGYFKPEGSVLGPRIGKGSWIGGAS